MTKQFKVKVIDGLRKQKFDAVAIAKRIAYLRKSGEQFVSTDDAVIYLTDEVQECKVCGRLELVDEMVGALDMMPCRECRG